MYCNMIATVAIISTSITSHNYLFFLVVGIIKFQSLQKFDNFLQDWSCFLLLLNCLERRIPLFVTSLRNRTQPLPAHPSSPAQKLALTGQTLCVSSQRCIQRHHVRSLKLATLGVFTLRKMAKATNQRFCLFVCFPESQIKHLPAQRCPNLTTNSVAYPIRFK